MVNASGDSVPVSWTCSEIETVDPMLAGRIYAAQDVTERKRSEERKSQVGTGDRSGRIRTYNFPQGRVTDHRIGLTLYKLEQVIAGDALGEVVDALVTEHQAALLAAVGDEAA